ncbi:MAG: DUF2934 domain-containing protein [Acidobacteriia bacterium]|nr:DUF2934 domain-containing protein [Terriglobia bacterium]
MARPKSPTGKQKDAIASSSPAAAAQAAPADNSQSETRTDTRKLEVVKGDSRPNLVPINLDDEIRRRAYELSERRGFESGHETEDWLSAEHEVLQRYRQQSA